MRQGKEDLKIRLGRRIVGLRGRAGLSQTALAQDSELSRRHLGAIERGDGPAASVDSLERIARALGVSFSQLTNVDEDQPREGREEAERLGKLTTELAFGASPDHLELFERVVRAFFERRPEP